MSSFSREFDGLPAGKQPGEAKRELELGCSGFNDAHEGAGGGEGR